MPAEFGLARRVQRRVPRQSSLLISIPRLNLVVFIRNGLTIRSTGKDQRHIYENTHTEIRFFDFKSKKEKVLERGQSERLLM